jgi:hypothetical protein
LNPLFVIRFSSEPTDNDDSEDDSNAGEVDTDDNYGRGEDEDFIGDRGALIHDIQALLSPGIERIQDRGSLCIQTSLLTMCVYRNCAKRWEQANERAHSYSDPHLVCPHLPPPSQHHLVLSPSRSRLHLNTP